MSSEKAVIAVMSVTEHSLRIHSFSIARKLAGTQRMSSVHSSA